MHAKKGAAAILQFQPACMSEGRLLALVPKTYPAPMLCAILTLCELLTLPLCYSPPLTLTCPQGVRTSAATLQPLASAAYSLAHPPLATQRASATNTAAPAGADSPYHQRPARDLQLELSVLKAIKSREDVLERLKVREGETLGD